MRRRVMYGMMFALAGILGVTGASTATPAYAQATLVEPPSFGSDDDVCPMNGEWYAHPAFAFLKQGTLGVIACREGAQVTRVFVRYEKYTGDGQAEFRFGWRFHNVDPAHAAIQWESTFTSQSAGNGRSVRWDYLDGLPTPAGACIQGVMQDRNPQLYTTTIVCP